MSTNIDSVLSLRAAASCLCLVLRATAATRQSSFHATYMLALPRPPRARALQGVQGVHSSLALLAPCSRVCSSGLWRSACCSILWYASR